MLKPLKRGWSRWLRFAELVGNVQMIILLTIIYWTLLALVAIPFKFLADPLAIRRPSAARWRARRPASNVFESMRRQG